MKQSKKLGRGLEDFSHLFLTTPPESKKVLPDMPRASSIEERGESGPARIIAVACYKPLDERAFLVINLASEMARQGKSVLVFDADVSLPRLYTMIEECTSIPLAQLITNREKAVNAVKLGDGITLVTLDADFSTLSSLGHDDRRRFLDNFNRLEEDADVILILASPGFSPNMNALFHAVDEIIVITPQPLAEMINTYGLIKFIFQLRENAHVGIVSCRVTGALQAGMVYEKMKRVVMKFLHKPLRNYGFIPADEETVNALRARKYPLTPSSMIFSCITDISRALFELDPPCASAPGSDTQVRGLAERLFSWGDLKK